MAQPAVVPKNLGCFPNKGLKLSLQRLKSPKSNSNLSSPRSPFSPSAPSSTPTPKPATWRDELREVFRRFDSDSDGKISAAELREYFASVGEVMSLREAEAVVDEVDTDGDNLIDFRDFVGLMKRGGNKDDDLKAAFQAFEFERGSGRITPKSLQRVLSRLGDEKSHDECVAMIRVFDRDGDGELDFHEFNQMMA